uniref:28 kDa protein n=1 Tax=Persimmon virus B TaxID=1493829 RepID=A0A0A8JD04_9CLOS|nr:28 kDa protein [Persimmon virus B]
MLPIKTCLRKMFVRVSVHLVISFLLTLLRLEGGETFGDTYSNNSTGCYFWDVSGNKVGTTIISNTSEAIRYYVSRNFSPSCGAGATLIEWTYKSGVTFYDISCVDGFSCSVTAACDNKDVYYSHLDSKLLDCASVNLCGDCISNCIRTNDDSECCIGVYNAYSCRPTWSTLLKEKYKNYFNGVYTYAYDDAYGLHQCASSVIFKTITDERESGITDYPVKSGESITCNDSVDRLIRLFVIGIVKELLSITLLGIFN